MRVTVELLGQVVNGFTDNLMVRAVTEMECSKEEYEFLRTVSRKLSTADQPVDAPIMVVHDEDERERIMKGIN